MSLGGDVGDGSSSLASGGGFIGQLGGDVADGSSSSTPAGGSSSDMRGGAI
jgi:hypothetical protein